MSTSPNTKVQRNGQTLTRRAWDLIADAARAAGLDPDDIYVGQGGFKGGGGASASAGTHDGGDVFDIRLRNLPHSKWVTFNTELRRRNVCAWVRSADYGWTSTGPHIHGVLRDSYYPLSSGAKQQVRDYDNGRNGLASGRPDPFPRPKQYPYRGIALVKVAGVIRPSASQIAAVLKTGTSRVRAYNPKLRARRAKIGEWVRVPPGATVPKSGVIRVKAL